MKKRKSQINSLIELNRNKDEKLNQVIDVLLKNQTSAIPQTKVVPDIPVDENGLYAVSVVNSYLGIPKGYALKFFDELGLTYWVQPDETYRRVAKGWFSKIVAAVRNMLGFPPKVSALDRLDKALENEITNILTHSGCKAIYIHKRFLPKLSAEIQKKLKLVIDIDDFSVISRDDDAFTCDGRTCTSQPSPPARCWPGSRRCGPCGEGPCRGGSDRLCRR